MAVFEVRGMDASGKNVVRVIDAENERAARVRLRREGVFATQIKAKAGRGSTEETKSESKGLGREVDLAKYFERITTDDIAALTRQLATLLGAGIPLVQTLAAVTEQTENEKLKVILSSIKERVNEGASLADSMKDHPKVFSDLYVNMVRAGEQSGAIEHVLEQLADYTEKQSELRSEILGALFYPAILGMLAMCIIFFLMSFVVPKITTIFEDQEIVLPLITRLVIFTSDFTASFWWLIAMVIGAAIYVFRRWHATEEGRKKTDDWMLTVPLFGRLTRLTSISRFSSTLATLLGAGIPLLRAMHIVSAILGNVILQKAIDVARENISEGQSIARPLRASGHFPPLLLSMIETGERTGELEPMLRRVALSYEREVQRKVRTLTALIEPMMIVAMGGIALIITLSIMLPMMQMSKLAG